MPRSAIIQADQSYSFSDYFKLNFAPQDILAYFDATLQRRSLKLPQYDGELERLYASCFISFRDCRQEPRSVAISY